MMPGAFLCIATALISVLWLTPVGAHHSILAKFDPNKPIQLNGTVTKVNWANPHTHVFIDATAQDGSVTNWAIELEGRVDLRRNGWTQDSLQIGELVSVEGIAARDGSEQLWGRSIVVASTGARVFVASAGDPNASDRADQPPAPTPRWPDGRPRLGPLPGELGYWASPSATSLVETGVEVEVDKDGLLNNIADAPRVAPFQGWAEHLYRMRQMNFLKDDPLFLYCMPPGGPRQYQLPYGVQFLEQPDRERIFALTGSGNRNWRLIYTDGRDQIGSVEGNLDNPLFYGRAVAHWEGDTLVIDTAGFNERFWFSNGGLPHTDQLRLVERLSRPDFNTLIYDVTIDDPGAYTRPWTSSWTLEWISGPMPEYFCQDNRP